MTPIEHIAEIVQLGLALSAFWVLLFLSKAYRVDALRDRLFAVRQKLFDYADSGEVEFSDPAYTKLRHLLNSLIRFAHHLTFTRFALGVVWVSRSDPALSDRPLEEWRRAVSRLPSESRERLEEIHAEALVLVVRHLITGSPIMVGVGILFTLWLVVHGVTRFSLRLLAERLPGLDSLQSQAIMADPLERKFLRDGAAPA